MKLGIGGRTNRLWAGWIAAADDEAVATILRLGGTIERDEKLPGKPPVGVSFNSVRIVDGDLDCLRGMAGIRKLDLGDTRPPHVSSY